MQAREDFAFDQKVMGCDGREVIQPAFTNTTVVAVNERSWEVQGAREGGAARRPRLSPREGGWSLDHGGNGERRAVVRFRIRLRV